MKKTMLVALLLLTTSARAEDGYAELHNTAHFGAGAGIAMVMAWLLRVGDPRHQVPPWARAALEVTGAAAGGLFKEAMDKDAGGPFNLQQATATTLGGVAVALTLNF